MHRIFTSSPGPVEREPWADARASLAADPPLGSHLGVAIEDVAQVQATSGTTGSPSYIGLTDADLRTWAELGARALRA